jgi:CRISPR type III-B/RAMP module RAMP protein Cmr6
MIRRSSPTHLVRTIADEGSKTRVEHVGLAHEKLAPHATKADKEAQSRFIRNLAGNSGVPRGYESHFRRHVRRTPRLTDGPWQRRVAVVVSQGRVLCGMGERTPTENGLSIHTTYGVPVLPGSSLKGITRAWLKETAPDSHWRDGGDCFVDAFGRQVDADIRDDIGMSGLVHFLDALWVPGDASLPASPWAAEILTPHFGKYYDGREAPDGTQAPIPITFLAAQGGFRVVLEGPDGLVDRVMEHLLVALLNRGVGAKGRSGFGRFTNWGDKRTRDDMQEERAGEEARAERERQAEFSRATTVDAMLNAIRTHESDADLRKLVADWLAGKDGVDPRLEMFAVTAESATCVVTWARKAGVAKGLVKRVREHLDPVVLAVLEQAPQPTPAEAAGGWGPNHLDAFEDPSGFGKRKKAKWPNGFANRIKDGRHDEDTVRRALAHLRAHGGKTPHFNIIRNAYGLPEE